MFHCYTLAVTKGPHKGRKGNVVSIPWLGNLWNLRMTLNVPAEHWESCDASMRNWIKVLAVADREAFVLMRKAYGFS